MKISKYLFQFFIAALMLSACDNEENENPGKGESINSFKLMTPANFSSLILNPGTPDKVIQLQWETAKTGLGGTATYTVLFDKEGGDFSNPILAVEADNGGKDSKASVTIDQLVDAVAGTETEKFIWTVEAKTVHESGENKVKATNAFTLDIQVSSISISDFSYISPAPNEKLLLDKVRTPNDEIVFEWTTATSASGTVTYRWIAATSPEGFDEPVLEFDSDNDGAATTFTLTHGELKDLLDEVDYQDGLFWKVEASVSDVTYSPGVRFMWFEIFDVPTLYIVGSFTNGWNNNCTDAIQLTSKGGGVFESLVNIPAGAEFKLVLACGSWDVNWGSPISGNITSGAEYAIVSPGDNIKVQDAGSYFVRADFSSGKFKLTKFTPPADVFLVGGSTSADWNPANSIKFIETSTNVFEIYAYIETAGSGFKFLEVQDWAGDWGSKGGSRTVAGNGVITGDLVQDGEDNATIEANGFHRITLDYNTLKYKIEPMTWGIIGSARTGDGNGWNAQDNMTFVGGKGSYKWTITRTLFNGELKFRANDDWGINFGDNGANGSVEYNGSNIAVTAGTYVIELTLDPINGYSYTITPQ
jgi:hypothetical protein